MGYEHINVEETQRACIKFLKKLVEDIENGNKIITKLNVEEEINDIREGMLIVGHVYTGKDWITIDTQRINKNESI